MFLSCNCPDVPIFNPERNKSSSVNSGVPTLLPEQSTGNESSSLDLRAPVLIVPEQYSSQSSVEVSESFFE